MRLPPTNAFECEVVHGFGHLERHRGPLVSGLARRHRALHTGRFGAGVGGEHEVTVPQWYHPSECADRDVRSLADRDIDGSARAPGDIVSPMDRISTDLAAYYEEEAGTRVARPIDAERVARRQRFVDRCRSEQIESILDVGMGPGRDAVAMAGAGIRAMGVDLAHESARLAHLDGIPAIQGSLYALPVASRSVDAVWTMSTLVHVPDAMFDEALSEMVRITRVDGLIAVGLWGGRDHEGVIDFEPARAGRFFSLRTEDRARSMLQDHGELTEFETWGGFGSHDWEYQFAVLRNVG